MFIFIIILFYNVYFSYIDNIVLKWTSILVHVIHPSLTSRKFLRRGSGDRSRCPFAQHSVVFVSFCSLSYSCSFSDGQPPITYCLVYYHVVICGPVITLTTDTLADVIIHGLRSWPGSCYLASSVVQSLVRACW